jgi:predicted RNA polymerase sigma factor
LSTSYEGGRRPYASLEAEFQHACDAAVDACRRLSPPYNPTAWVGMSGRHGAAEAARRLVVSGDIQTGFERLVQAGRPELTIEWAILDSRWKPIFKEQHREAARWRLRQAGIQPPA